MKFFTKAPTFLYHFKKNCQVFANLMMLSHAKLNWLQMINAGAITTWMELIKKAKKTVLQWCAIEMLRWYISTIEMRSLWTELKCIKSTTRLLNIEYVNKGDLDLSKEVLWVSVGQRTAVLWAIKVGGKKKFCRMAWFEPDLHAPGQSPESFYDLQIWQPVALLPFDLQRPKAPF